MPLISAKKWNFLLLLLILSGATFFGYQWKQSPCHQPVSLDDQLRYEKFKLSKALVQIPEIELISQKNETTKLIEELDKEKPVFLQFIFTTCPTICPVLSSHFSSFQEIAEKEEDDVLMISISIDPEYDTPNKLEEYAAQFRARSFWNFYTGNKKDIGRLQASLKNYHDNKMNHRPATYYRDVATSSWFVYEGFISGQDLWNDYQKHSVL